MFHSLCHWGQSLTSVKPLQECCNWLAMSALGEGVWAMTCNCQPVFHQTGLLSTAHCNTPSPHLCFSSSPIPPQESMDFYQAKLFSGCVILLLTPKAPVKPLRVSLGPVLPDRAPMEPRLHLHLTVHWIQESFDSREADRGWNYEQRHSTISFS